MRIGLCLAMLLTIAAAPHKPVARSAPKPAPIAAPLPQFEFRGIRAGEPADPAALAKCGAGEKVECLETGVEMADAYLMGLTTTYYRGKLSGIEIFAKTIFFKKLTDAFTTKYGKPCKAEMPKVQNRMGASFDNIVLTWCFASGNLKAEMFGVDLDTSLITYEDRNQAPKPEPKVDF